MDAPQIRLLRFADLKAAQVVTSWPQLKRLVEKHGFPAGYMLSPAVRVWDANAVEDWLESRRRAAAQAHSEAVGA
ncbi:helix-turn-helix transcriptional regulator [Phenylobacterium terrae]|uniref:Helix-turn-helix transcriptional regulator n=1 Tax=Phenylobacterium terrae TaxID=2665495 RepID=A0ABW4N4X7_9CAUL